MNIYFFRRCNNFDAAWVGGWTGAGGKCFVTCRGCSPFLFLLVHGDAARPEGHHHQQAADDGEGLKDERLAHVCLLSLKVHLEEIVFEEVSHGLVGRDGPPGVEVEVENVEPGDQDQG